MKDFLGLENFDQHQFDLERLDKTLAEKNSYLRATSIYVGLLILKLRHFDLIFSRRCVSAFVMMWLSAHVHTC